MCAFTHFRTLLVFYYIIIITYFPVLVKSAINIGYRSFIEEKCSFFGTDMITIAYSHKNRMQGFKSLFKIIFFNLQTYVFALEFETGISRYDT